MTSVDETVPSSSSTAPAWDVDQRRWASGWRGIVVPGAFLLYLAQTAHGVGQHSSGWAVAAGLAVLAAFCVAYLGAMQARWAGRHRWFWWLYGALAVLMVVELPFAHEDALVMCVYLAVLAVAVLGPRSVPVVVGIAAVVTFVPALVPSWELGIDADSGVTILLVSVAMFGFFGLVRANRELSGARVEVARLAAEGERNRIARDLHDLLGHSLTTITIKAGLARRLAERDPRRAVAEITEVEDLARRSLTEVRAAVSGYREVTLAGELATAGEVLRAAGITASLPPAIEHVPADRRQLFAWVVREGVTNVVRHSRATSCTIAVGADWLEVVDDGTAPAAPVGNGLTGLRERVAAAGGVVVAGPWPTDGPATGWRLRVDVSGDRAGGAPQAAPTLSSPSAPLSASVVTP
ncbi:MAG: histidine kinase [Ilumatobacteraceae bacterium]